VRKIRGKKSKTVDELFNEVGAALQFPWYFGENWDAFDECMSDLDWLPGDTYLLLISQGKLLLYDESRSDFRVLIRILTDASVNWSESRQALPDVGPVPAYRIVFQVDAQDLASFSERMAQADATLQVL
jgi:hypothetical protein